MTKRDPILIGGLPPLLTIQETMQATGLGDKTIRRRIADGTLTAYRVGPRALRIERSSLLKLVTPIGAAGGAA
jgi:excisionase family DNA binding protein